MVNYNKVRFDNVRMVDKEIHKFIEEMQLQDEISYFIYSDDNYVKIVASKTIDDKVHGEYLEVLYSRKFYMPFDNEDVCKDTLNDIYKLFLDVETLGICNIF